MMTQDRDYEDALRRALAAAAESIEPTGDGLQRIRHRLDSSRSPRPVLSVCAKWLELHGTRVLVRLEPAIETGRAALKRTGPLRGPLLALASFLAGLFIPRGRRRAGGHRGPASRPGRLGPAGPWLKPVFAVSAAVAIVVGGVVILNHETQTVIGQAGSYGTASPGTSEIGRGTTSNSKRWKVPLGVSTSQPFAAGDHKSVKSAPVLPAVACTPTPKPVVTTTAPAGSPTATPIPTVSGTATGTPTATPTGSPLPTPTSTTSPATSGTATAATAAMDVPYHAVTPIVVECGATSTTSPTP